MDLQEFEAIYRALETSYERRMIDLVHLEQIKQATEASKVLIGMQVLRDKVRQFYKTSEEI